MERSTLPSLHEVAKYYSSALATHGTTANGVDWNGEIGQILRFAQLSKLFLGRDAFSVNDLGCGYGALVEYLDHQFVAVQYRGIDICEEMIRAANERFVGKELPGHTKATFFVGDIPNEMADFSVASGIFNVKLGYSAEEWQSYLCATLDALNAASRDGFAFNCLTSYSDRDKMRANLHYADPCVLFDHCKRRYSRQVALLHDYGLYEFTIHVRKTA